MHLAPVFGVEGGDSTRLIGNLEATLKLFLIGSSEKIVDVWRVIQELLSCSG